MDTLNGDYVHRTEAGTMGLGIREARQTLPTLVKRVAYAGEEVAIGSHGRDEVTLIGTAELRRLRSELAAAQRTLRGAAVAGEGEGRPFQGLQAALEAGALRASPSASRPRRRITRLVTESVLNREEQARLGARGDHEPRYRRTKPRS
jgi:prevent-host-death family protein